MQTHVLILIGWLVAFTHTRHIHHSPVYGQGNSTALPTSTPRAALRLRLDAPHLQIAHEWDPDFKADAAAIEKFKSRGSFMMCLLAMTDAEAGRAWPDPYQRTPATARSLFQGTLENELLKWAWFDAPFDQAEFCNFHDPSNSNEISKALAALGINPYESDIGGHNTCYSIEHYDAEDIDEDDPNDEADPEQQAYDVNGVEYICTGAYYRFGINHIDGAIFAQHLLSPLRAAEEIWIHHVVTKDALPALRLGSDIIFAYWLRDNPNPKSLKYYFFNHVNNDATIALVASIVAGAVPDKSKRAEALFWPGLTYGMNTPEGQALLGSPLGITLGYLLLQHKAELGLKTVQDVTIFRDDTVHPVGSLYVQLVFRIVDVPEEKLERSDQIRERNLLHVRRFDV